MIDIGRPIISENGIHYINSGANESRVFVGQPINNAPPPYSIQSARFCSQCGAPGHDPTMKSCSSCGQSFNKH